MYTTEHGDTRLQSQWLIVNINRSTLSGQGMYMYILVTMHSHPVDVYICPTHHIWEMCIYIYVLFNFSLP